MGPQNRFLLHGQEATELTNLEGDNSSLVMDLEFSAGNFLPGQHAVFVRAIDSAGNERSLFVIFVVDECHGKIRWNDLM